MTTAAWDGDMLAVDSLATVGDYVDFHMNKLTKLKDGSYCVTCGVLSDSIAFKDWMNKGGPMPKLDDSFSAMVVDGKNAYFYSEKLIRRKLKPPYAIGSGWVWATAAMDCGKNARESVKYASKRDCITGGRVRYVKASK